MKGGPKGRQELRIGVSQITSTPFLPEILPFILHPQALIRILPVDWPYTIPFGILYPWVQIASPNGHLCHIRRPLCDLIGGQLGTH